MGATQALVSIGDEGVLNVQVSPSLSDVWIDRDLSWLDFNERVLAEAVDARTPLLERAKFLAIFTARVEMASVSIPNCPNGAFNCLYTFPSCCSVSGCVCNVCGTAQVWSWSRSTRPSWSYVSWRPTRVSIVGRVSV